MRMLLQRNKVCTQYRAHVILQPKTLLQLVIPNLFRLSDDGIPICVAEGRLQCPCLYNFNGSFCDECALGYWNFPDCQRKIICFSQIASATKCQISCLNSSLRLQSHWLGQRQLQRRHRPVPLRLQLRRPTVRRMRRRVLLLPELRQ